MNLVTKTGNRLTIPLAPPQFPYVKFHKSFHGCETEIDPSPTVRYHCLRQ